MQAGKQWPVLGRCERCNSSIGGYAFNERPKHVPPLTESAKVSFWSPFASTFRVFLLDIRDDQVDEV